MNQHKIHVLLAVWGMRFIDDFLNLNLYSLLAPGNVPALTKKYETTFVILTRLQDVQAFEKHVAFQKLRSICEIKFIAINDLILLGNHSTTLTLAFDRAVRSTKEAMLETYFIFLDADYVVADGSFVGLMRYIEKGYSGICAGNFQVLPEKMKPFLQKKIDTCNHMLQVSPRALLKKSFKWLHPATLANMYAEKHLHNYQANRFFLRHDHNILVGRFYLLHMICIKPERVDYTVGSSSDYSFIPEMCPSQNVAIINDSDDYLVIEMQPKDHELSLVRMGPYKIKKLAKGLAEWTTRNHRDNAKTTIYYHTKDIDHHLKETLDKTIGRFIASVNVYLEKYKSKPYRHHPYWLGAVDGLNTSYPNTNQTDNDIAFACLNHRSKLKKIFHFFFGHPPTVFLWHYRWLEYHWTMKYIKRFLNQAQAIVSFYDATQLSYLQYNRWLNKKYGSIQQYQLQSMNDLEVAVTQLSHQSFTHGLFFISISQLKYFKQYIVKLKPFFVNQSRMLIILQDFQNKNHSPYATIDLKDEFMTKMNEISRMQYKIKKIDAVYNNFSLMGLRIVRKINFHFNHQKSWRIALRLVGGLPGMVISFLRNIVVWALKRQSGYCTNIVVTLESKEITGTKQCA